MIPTLLSPVSSTISSVSTSSRAADLTPDIHPNSLQDTLAPTSTLCRSRACAIDPPRALRVSRPPDPLLPTHTFDSRAARCDGCPRTTAQGGVEAHGPAVHAPPGREPGEQRAGCAGVVLGRGEPQGSLRRGQGVHGDWATRAGAEREDCGC